MGDADREHWNQRWADREPPGANDSSLLQLVEQWLPERGRLLDIAGGGSGDAVRLAECGLDVTVVDVSDVGLALTSALAIAADVPVTTIQADLESDPPPAGPWNVITLANYLNRPLVLELSRQLAPGGTLAVVLATSTNLERNPRPSAAYLVEPGEILDLTEGLEVDHHSESWRDNGRHEAWFVGHEKPSEGTNNE